MSTFGPTPIASTTCCLVIMGGIVLARSRNHSGRSCRSGGVASTLLVPAVCARGSPRALSARLALAAAAGALDLQVGRGCFWLLLGVGGMSVLGLELARCRPSERPARRPDITHGSAPPSGFSATGHKLDKWSDNISRPKKRTSRDISRAQYARYFSRAIRGDGHATSDC
jgi:hypothetical protein